MPGSKRSPPAAAANRGCINERQWSDIRRAAALAQEKGVRLTLHGVSVMPADSTHAGGSPQRATAEQAKAPRRANDDAQPPETRGGVPSEAPSKKRQRDAQRLAEYRESQRVGQSWHGGRCLPASPSAPFDGSAATKCGRAGGARRRSASRRRGASCAMCCAPTPGRSGLAATSRCRARRSRRLGVWCIPSAERRSRRCRCATSSS